MSTPAEPRVAVIFDDRERPETTGVYCRRALSQFCRVTHFQPEQLPALDAGRFDLCLFIDDGLSYPLPAGLPRSAYWAIDTHLDPAYACERGRQVAFRFAAQRDGAELLARAGLPTTWLPLACDPSCHRPHGLPKRWDVVFVGMIVPGPREELLELVQRNFPHSFIGQCYGDEYARTLSQARIGFNRSFVNDVNMRVFETLGCGTLLLTNDLQDNGLAELFEGDRHLVTYHTAEELLDKLRFYLAHDVAREWIAQAGRREVLARHTYHHRMRTLVAAVLGDAQPVGRLTGGGAAEASAGPGGAGEQGDRPGWIESVDFVVKTYLRPRALLRLLWSIERHYPAAHVTIADDGELAASSDQDSRACRALIAARPDWELLTLPRDSGVVAGRNALIHATRRPYLLFLDDDFRFTEATRIERLWLRLQEEPATGLVAGSCWDVQGGARELRNSGGTFQLHGETLEITTGAWRDRERGLRDYIPQFFLARRGVFETVRWRGGLGGEHYDFCLQLQRSAWRVAQDLSVTVDHDLAIEALPGYRERRLDVAAAQQQLLETWGLQRVVQDGQVILQRADAAARLETPTPPVRQTVTTSHAGRGRELPRDPCYFRHPRPEVAALVPATARRVLDIGCGAGALGALLKSQRAVEVVGVEMHPTSAAAARQGLDQVIEADVEDPNVSFPEGAFDCVICADVLEHLRQPGAVLAKIRRWLTPDGRLVASVPNVRHHSVIASLLDGNWTYESAGLLDQDHLRFFTRRELEKLLDRCGFAVESWQALRGPGDEASANGHAGHVEIGRLQLHGLPPGAAEEFLTYQFLVAARPQRWPPRDLTSIVLVTFNECDYTAACLDSIRLRTDEPYELIVVDNGSTDETVAYLRSQPDVTLIANADNRGFPAAANQGIRAARGQNILLLNNDTLVTTGWLRRLLEVFDRHPEVGLVGPVSNHCSGRQVVIADYDRLESLDGFAWDWYQAYRGQTVATDRLVGFCLLFRREVVERIGLLDEQFGIGNYEDDDFCRRARAAGFGAMIAADTYIHHFGSRTFRASGVDLAGLLEENRRKYEAKWAAGPADQDPSADPAAAAAQCSGRSPDRAPEPSLEGGGASAAAPAIEEAAAILASSAARDSAAPAPHYTARPRARLLVQAVNGNGLRLVKNTIRLSACLIVRDNEATIGACLASILPYVDEVVVVDTGSTDRTPEICLRHGARLFRFPWCDDFSAARNVSLDHARGEWLFWLDSDDTVPAACGLRLRGLADGEHAPHVLGYVMQVHCPGPDDGSHHNLTVVDHVKLIRHRPDLRFEGRIHEQLLPAIRRAQGEVAWTDIYVVHSGADQSPEGLARKLERDLRILHRELRERPEHPFVLFNLGMTYADAQRYEEAIGYLQRCLRGSRPEESHLRKAYALLVNALSQSQRHDEADDVCQQALSCYPEDKELLFRSAMLHHQFGRLQAAEQAYLRVLHGHEERHFASVDQGVAGYKARHNLALVYGDLGALEEAQAQWRDLTRLAPDFLPAWRELVELLIRQGQWDDAARACDELLQRGGPCQREGLYLRGRLAAARHEVAAAESDLQAAERLDPRDLEPLRCLCWLEFEHGELDAAEVCLQRLTQRAPDDPAALHNLGTVQFRRGAWAAAVDSYRRSLALRPDSAATWLQLGWALRDSGDQPAALHAWREALRYDSQHPDALKALATARDDGSSGPQRV